MPSDSVRAQSALAAQLLAAHPRRSALALAKESHAEVADVLSRQPSRVAARVLERMTPVQAAGVLTALRPEAAATIIGETNSPVVATALRWLPESEIDTVLSAAPERVAREIRDLMNYPADSAGALMDPRVVVARPTDTVGDALAGFEGVDKPVYQIHVVDDRHHLLGTVPLQRLATAPRDASIQSLLVPDAPTLDAFTFRDEVLAMLTQTGTPSIAVVDAEGRLVGVLRHRVLLGLAEEEAVAKMQQMVGANRDEKALSPVLFAVRKRLPWLNINLLTAFLAAAVVGLFENTIAQVTSLAILLPVVAGQSGNSGSQALAVTMRGLALREIRAMHWPRVAAKEVMVGLTNGMAIATVTAVGVFVWSSSLPLAGVIAAAMVVSMAAAGLAGASVPIVLKSLGQDPAQSSSIILTTVTDVVGFSSFLGLATILADKLV